MLIGQNKIVLDKAIFFSGRNMVEILEELDCVGKLQRQLLTLPNDISNT
jgi:hypothetical protein